MRIKLLIARLKETAVSKYEQEFYDWLNKKWTEISDDIHPHVKDNRQAVEHLIDMTYHLMDRHQKTLCADLGIEKIARKVNVY